MGTSVGRVFELVGIEEFPEEFRGGEAFRRECRHRGRWRLESSSRSESGDTGILETVGSDH